MNDTIEYVDLSYVFNVICAKTVLVSQFKPIISQTLAKTLVCIQ